MSATVRRMEAQLLRRFKPYPAYKGSGVEWLGEIPAHWDIRKLKYVASTTFSNVDKHAVDGEEPVRLCNYTDVYYNDHITPHLQFMEATASREEIAKFQLRKGDVLVTKDSEEWEDIAVAAYVCADIDNLLCGYHLAQVRPNEGVMDGRYLFRAFRARGINDQFRVAATGITRFGLGKYWLDSGLFLAPPLPEQRAIAAFLDRETARIDALIEKKRRQIELLHEKRAALISQAVTKGIDPSAPMKDSGVEWLGEVPQHWDVLRLKYTAELVNEKVNGAASELPYTGLEHIESWTGKRLTTEAETSSDGQASVYRAGDVLFGKLRPYLAKAYAAQGDGICTGELLVLRPKTLVQGFLRDYLLNPSFISIVDSSTYGAKMPRADWEFIGNLPVLVPPLDEQRAIVGFLDRETARIDALIEKIRKSIDLLREYRTALISAAVTGKIDVRKEVA